MGQDLLSFLCIRVSIICPSTNGQFVSFFNPLNLFIWSPVYLMRITRVFESAEVKIVVELAGFCFVHCNISSSQVSRRSANLFKFSCRAIPYLFFLWCPKPLFCSPL